MSEEEANYHRAVELVRTLDRAGTAMLQRRLGIGYNQAARHMEKMEKAGIVSPADDRGQRMVTRNPLAHMEPEAQQIDVPEIFGDAAAVKATFDGMLELLIRLLVEGTLSEGQVAKATGLDRLQIRRIADKSETQAARYA